MAVETLKGTELIDCARANAKEGIEAAAERCGYGNNLNQFEQELKQACQEIGVDLQSFGELRFPQTGVDLGVEIAPDSATEL